MTITAETVTTTESRARARAFLTTVIGSPPDDRVGTRSTPCRVTPVSMGRSSW